MPHFLWHPLLPQVCDSKCSLDEQYHGQKRRAIYPMCVCWKNNYNFCNGCTREKAAAGYTSHLGLIGVILPIYWAHGKGEGVCGSTSNQWPELDSSFCTKLVSLAPSWQFQVLEFTAALTLYQNYGAGALGKLDTYQHRLSIGMGRRGSRDGSRIWRMRVHHAHLAKRMKIFDVTNHVQLVCKASLMLRLFLLKKKKPGHRLVCEHSPWKLTHWQGLI